MVKDSYTYRVCHFIDLTALYKGAAYRYLYNLCKKLSFMSRSELYSIPKIFLAFIPFLLNKILKSKYNPL